MTSHPSLLSILSLFILGGSLNSAEPSAIKILETKVISHQPEYYHGWSTVVRRTNGELWLSWSGGAAPKTRSKSA